MTVLVTPYVAADSGSQVADAIRDRCPDIDLVYARDEDAVRDVAPDAEIVVTSRVPDDLLAAADDLRWIQALSAGVDFIDTDALAARNVALTNVSGIHAKPIGQQVLGYLLYFSRRFDKAVAQQRRREWERYGGRELGDATVGIVGVGAIGSQVADYCDTLGARTLGVKRDPSDAPTVLDHVTTPDELSSVVAESDYLVLACPLTDETHHLIDRDALERLPDHAVVVNIARGPVVDQSALVDALEADDIRGAALDVFEEEPLPEASPLWEREDVLVTPHMAGTTPHYWERAADVFVTNLDHYRAGEPLENRIV